jgi:hypothetical protein
MLKAAGMAALPASLYALRNFSIGPELKSGPPVSSETTTNFDLSFNASLSLIYSNILTTFTIRLRRTKTGFYFLPIVIKPNKVGAFYNRQG